MIAAEDGQAVAVVGMSCRFPGAPDLDRYWAGLLDGAGALTPATEPELAAAGVPESLRRRPEYVPVSGRIEDFDLFDAEYFGLSPAEATATDPQQRLFLQEAVHALEHAGWTGADGRRVGVFCGSGENTYAQLLGQDAPVVPDSPATLPLRVSYHLDLRGPSVFVSSLCSTSLTAVHLARRSLLAGDCDLALAGAVNLRLPDHHGYLARPGGVASPEGALRPFDREASGTVPGSGVGAVVLKRLDAALRDGDTVHAVVRGSALNNDGADRQSFAAPSVRGQRDVVLAALADAGVDPGDIAYVEAHGTGTSLGDPVEIAALLEARERLGVTTDCVIGAVKSSVGHLDSAAGMAGFIKAVLAVREGTVPPTVGHEELNPRIRLDGTGLRVNGRAEPWPQTGGPRRAAVTALGIGGTNAHVVLEEPPAVPAAPARSGEAGPARIFPVSAHSPRSFERWRGLLAERVAGLTAADVAHTLQHRRTPRPLRRAWLATSATGLAAALSEPAAPVEAGPVVLGLDPRNLAPHGLDARLPEFLPALRADLGSPGEDGTEVLRAALWALGALADVPVLAGAGAGEYLALAAAGVLAPEVALRCADGHGRAVAAALPGADLSACERHLDAVEAELRTAAWAPAAREVRLAGAGVRVAPGGLPPADRLLDMTRGAVMGAEPPAATCEGPDLFAALGAWDRWLALVAHCWERGTDVPWHLVEGSGEGRVAPLPPYPFEETRHWPAEAPPASEAAVPAPARPTPADARREPQEHLAAIWQEVLGVDDVQPDDSFFLLGGHSLLASQVMARIWERLQVRVSLGDLLEAETLEGMAGLVAERLAAERLFTSLAPAADDTVGTVEL
ncbi:beta-ketoacyl [acyl carrier protein] synthase domain-containing protein [Streptomyces spectabilis]|nr:polyketide synthase [Streptomyces spectabilis]MBB5108885.1 acyl transferase domain-containing protein [Streptomyces spectabilis]MCI3899821.1 phosphopantetheine-binding protein [Streptomyces spectabilis]GGV42720.1 hypothetical protein GCM10010245_67070 [Streptomyces spectabilis]